MLLPTALNGQQPDPFLSDAELAIQFRERCEYVIDQVVKNTDPTNTARGGMFTVAANLHRGANLEWARAHIREANETPTGAMFWMHPMVLMMETGRGVLNDDDWAFIKELWRTYFPYRGDTENHWIMYYASIYLAAEMFPDAGPDQWYNGKSSAENMAEAKEYISDWIHITTSYGQGEYDSPNYIEEYTRPMALLAGWAQDPVVRQQGKMMMDYILLDYVVENIDGLYGGAHSRLYPRYLLQPSLTAGAAHGWLFFNQGEYRPNAGNTLIALSGYTPPPILYRIAHGRGDEAYVQRELKRTRWRLRHAGPDAFEIDGKSTTPVYKYSYVHPDYILGSSQGGLLQPIQQQTWSLIWREDDSSGKTNTMFGLQPYSSPLEGTMYFPSDWDTVTDLIARSKVDYDSPDKLEGGSPYEHVFQEESTLIALYDIPEGTRFPLISTLFSRDLKDRVEDQSGWIFGHGGPVYVAYRPFAPGEWKEVDWTGLLKSGAGAWFSTNFEELARGSQCFVSESLKNGYIVQVAPISEFESFDAFKKAIRELPLQYELSPTPSVRFTNLAGKELVATYGGQLSVDGKAVDHSKWKLFDGPFSRAERESETLEIHYGQERYKLDFKSLSTETTILEAE
ncbi:hypothetical protein [Pelagicoccus sp. SDUM812002]|uniref:hypothetical protein n=1 Tax=Pelagicoccus sp. SDUM812002 TaxID=3041266 RepID=UPI002811D056|nr:hypothetical protein [Pelagicoccus sp. SDUM812002]